MGRNPEATARTAQAAQVRKDRQKAKVVLKEFRDHFDELQKGKDEALDYRSPALSHHFKKAEANLNKARTVDQAYVDAQIFHKLGCYARRQAAQVQTGLSTYGVNSFVDALVMITQKTESSLAPDVENAPMVINFDEIGSSVQPLWKTVPVVEFMYGNEDVEVTRTAQQRQKPQPVKKGLVVTKPRELMRGEIEQTDTDKQVARMKGVLKRLGKINFWEFIVDPDEALGYTRTIENLFHFSFLVKDMYAILDFRPQPPTLEYADPHAPKDKAKGVPKSEIIMGFDLETWKKVIHKYNIRSCLLPRTSRRTAKPGVRDEDVERPEPMDVDMDESEEDE